MANVDQQLLCNGYYMEIYPLNTHKFMSNVMKIDSHAKSVYGCIAQVVVDIGLDCLEDLMSQHDAIPIQPNGMITHYRPHSPGVT